MLAKDSRNAGEIGQTMINSKHGSRPKDDHFRLIYHSQKECY